MRANPLPLVALIQQVFLVRQGNAIALGIAERASVSEAVTSSYLRNYRPSDVGRFPLF